MLRSPWELGHCPARHLLYFGEGQSSIYLVGCPQARAGSQDTAARQTSSAAKHLWLVKRCPPGLLPSQLTQVSGRADLPAISMLVPPFLLPLLFLTFLSVTTWGREQCATHPAQRATHPASPRPPQALWGLAISVGIISWVFFVIILLLFYLFSLRRRHREIRSVCSKMWVFVWLFW